MIKLPFTYLILIAFISLFASSQADGQTITIYLQNTGISTNHVQVRDDVCKGELPKECEYADIIVQRCKKKGKMRDNSEENKTYIDECEDAESTLDSYKCIEGLIYDGVIEVNEKVQLSICDGGSGSGNISVRAINNTSSWTRKFWLKDGDTIDHQ